MSFDPLCERIPRIRVKMNSSSRPSYVAFERCFVWYLPSGEDPGHLS